jgi:hypothetical protein
VHVFPILHPAAALRTPKLRPTMSEDFAALGQLLEEPAPEQEPVPGRPEERRAADAPEPARGDEQLDIFAP